MFIIVLLVILACYLRNAVKPTFNKKSKWLHTVHSIFLLNYFPFLFFFLFLFCQQWRKKRRGKKIESWREKLLDQAKPEVLPTTEKKKNKRAKVSR